MRYRQIITLMLAAVLLSGCGIYRNYERPSDIQADGLYGMETTTATTTPTIKRT